MFDPQINPQQAQSLADLMGGGSAGAYMGMQGAFQQDANMNNRALTLADLTKINQENELYKAKMPNEMAVSDAAGRNANTLTTDHYNTIRAGERGQSRTLQAQGDYDQRTLDSRVDETLGGNKSKALKRMGEDMTQVAAYIGGLPPEAQGPAMKEIIASRPWGAHESMAPAWEAFGKLPPDQMRAQLERAGTFMMNVTPAHIATLTAEREKAKSNEKIAAGHDAATRYSADQRANAAKKEADAAWKKANPVQKLEWMSQLVSQADENTDPYIELPDGTTMSLPNAKQAVKDMQTRIVSQRAASAQVGDNRFRELTNMNPVPNGNGTNGAVPRPRTWNSATGQWE
jgi:hypothetical protein